MERSTRPTACRSVLIRGGSDLTTGVTGLPGFLVLAVVILLLWWHDPNPARNDVMNERLPTEDADVRKANPLRTQRRSLRRIAHEPHGADYGACGRSDPYRCSLVLAAGLHTRFCLFSVLWCEPLASRTSIPSHVTDSSTARLAPACVSIADGHHSLVKGENHGAEIHHYRRGRDRRPVRRVLWADERLSHANLREARQARRACAHPGNARTTPSTAVCTGWSAPGPAPTSIASGKNWARCRAGA